MGLSAVLSALAGWLGKLPRSVQIGALAVVLAAVGGFWLYQRGEAVGRAQERLSADRRETRAAMTRLASVRQRADSQVAKVEAEKPVLEAVHDQVRPIDSVHVAVKETPTSKPDTIQLPGVVVARILTDSVAILERDSAIATLRAQAAAADSVIAAQAKQIVDMENAPTADRPSLLADATFGLAIGATAGGVAGQLVGAVVGAPIGFVGGVLFHVVLRR